MPSSCRRAPLRRWPGRPCAGPTRRRSVLLELAPASSRRAAGVEAEDARRGPRRCARGPRRPAGPRRCSRPRPRARGAARRGRGWPAARVELDRALALPRALLLEEVRALEHLQVARAACAMMSAQSDDGEREQHEAQARLPLARRRPLPAGRRVSSGRAPGLMAAPPLSSPPRSARRGASATLVPGSRGGGASTTTVRSGAGGGEAELLRRRSSRRAGGSRAPPSRGGACGSPRGAARARGESALGGDGRLRADLEVGPGVDGDAGRDEDGDEQDPADLAAACADRRSRTTFELSIGLADGVATTRGIVSGLLRRSGRPRGRRRAACALRERGLRADLGLAGPQRLLRQDAEALARRERGRRSSTSRSSRLWNAMTTSRPPGVRRRATLARGPRRAPRARWLTADAQRLEGAGGRVDAAAVAARARRGARCRRARWWCVIRCALARRDDGARDAARGRAPRRTRR